MITIPCIEVTGADLGMPQLERDQQYVRTTLQDNGIGFNKQEAEQIFQTLHVSIPIIRTKAPVSGSPSASDRFATFQRHLR